MSTSAFKKEMTCSSVLSNSLPTCSFVFLHLQMPSRCRNALNIVVTTLFAAVVLFTILLAYVTGCDLERHTHNQTCSPESKQVDGHVFFYSVSLKATSSSTQSSTTSPLASMVPSSPSTSSSRASSPSWSTGG